jgi:adenylate cyclase
MSRVQLARRQFDKAVQSAERAVALNPNSAEANASLGRLLVFTGKPKEGAEMLNKAIRLNPIPPAWYAYMLGSAYLGANDYNQSMAAYQKALQAKPNDSLIQAGLVAAYGLAGRQQEARALASELLKLHPDFSLEQVSKRMPYKNAADADRIMVALRTAGLK